MSTAPADPFLHVALLYRGKDEYLDGTTPFVANAIEAGEPVLVAVPEHNIAPLRERLGDQAHDVHFLDMTEVGRNPGRIIPGVLMAFGAGKPAARLWIIGEPIWPGRTPLEYPACVQHEALINTAFAGRRGTILCAYDVGGLEEHMIEDVERTHPLVVDCGIQRPSFDYTEPAAVVEAYNIPLPKPPQDAQRHEFTVGSLARTRRIVERFATRCGLRRMRVEDFVLAANELMTNSILHSNGHGVLRLWREQNTAVCEVIDEGTTKRPTFNGFGFVMVNLLCDLVRTHTSHRGTTVRVYLRR